VCFSYYRFSELVKTKEGRAYCDRLAVVLEHAIAPILGAAENLKFRIHRSWPVNM
jgi:hypothetical protein